MEFSDSAGSMVYGTKLLIARRLTGASGVLFPIGGSFVICVASRKGARWKDCSHVSQIH